MKPECRIPFLCLLLVTGNLFGQTNDSSKKLLQGFDAASQSNVEVIASGGNDEVPCPPEYTNVISNTNLFTAYEQKLLNDIASDYGNEVSNTVPPGSVLVSFKATPIQTSWGTHWDWVARLQFTNSDLTDEISPGGDLFRHKVRNTEGDGYDFGIVPTKLDHVPYDYTGVAGPEFWFQQIKHGVKDGLSVSIIHGDHCQQWMRYSNGWAVDKKLYWDPNYDKLAIWAKFKEPFDIDRTHDPDLQAAEKIFRAWTTNALNAVPQKPPTSAEQLRSELETAVNNKDISTAISLVCWDGQDIEVKEMIAGMLAEELAKSGTNTIHLTLAPVPAGFEMTKSSFLPDWEGDNGKRGKYNLPVIGMIHVDFSGKNEPNKYPDAPYGKKGDVFYVARMVSYQIPGKALRVRVDNIGRSLTYTGYWTYVSSGKEITISISDQTNEFREGWGDYVKYCYVQRTSTNETPGFAPFFQYKITEGQITNMFVGTHQFTEEVPVVIFDSGQITNEEPVIYERK
jgi:hypothetical protein